MNIARKSGSMIDPTNKGPIGVKMSSNSSSPSLTIGCLLKNNYNSTTRLTCSNSEAECFCILGVDASELGGKTSIYCLPTKSAIITHKLNKY